MAVDHNNPQSRTEEILIATIDGEEYDKLPQSRLEELLLELKETIEAGGGGGGTTNYNLLSNLPKINNVTVKGEMTASDLSLVLAEVGKGLSTNDYSDEEKAKVANLLAAIEGILTGSDIDSFGDVESALANKVDKVNGKSLSTNDFTDTYKDTIDANTTAITAIKDGTDIDSFGDVEVALLDKADISDLGTAAAKDSTNSVTAGSTDLVESGAVKDAIDSAVAAAYHHAGTKTVAQLTHDLLIAANEGNVYNITDSGTTTSDFIEGIGKTIDEGSNVGICKVGDVYMFDLLSGFVDTTNFVQKSQTAGLLNNDGTVNTTIEDDVDSLKSGLTNITNLTESMTAINSTITRGYAYRRGNTVTVFVDVTKNAFGWECVGGLPKPLTNGTQDLLISAIDLSDNSPIMGYVDNSGRLCCLNDTDSGQYRISGTYATMD